MFSRMVAGGALDGRRPEKNKNLPKVDGRGKESEKWLSDLVSLRNSRSYKTKSTRDLGKVARKAGRKSEGRRVLARENIGTTLKRRGGERFILKDGRRREGTPGPAENLTE